MYPVAVLAGGVGSRIAAINEGDLPKVLLPVAGRPFIDYKLASLAAEGVEDVVLLAGHRSELVERHVGAGGRYGLSVTYSFDGPHLLGTGGALRRALPQLGDVFWVTYGDTVLTVPMKEVEESYRASRATALMTVLRNCDRWDRSNVAVADGMVVEYRKGAAPGTFEYIDYGMSIVPAEAFEELPADRPFDLHQVLSGFVAANELAAFEVQERFYEIGTPESYRETATYLESRNPNSLRRARV